MSVASGKHKSWRFRKAKHPLLYTEMETTVVVGLVALAVVMVLVFNAILPPPSVTLQLDPVAYGQNNYITGSQVTGHTGDKLAIVIVNSAGTRTFDSSPFDTATLGAGTYTVYAYDTADGRYSDSATLVITKAIPVASLMGPNSFDFDGNGGKITFSINQGAGVTGMLLVNGTQVASTSGTGIFVTQNDPGVYTVSFESNGTMNYSGFIKTLNFSIMPNLIFNVTQNLTDDLDVQGNITISPGVILFTNGYSLIAGGAIINQGMISGGFSPSGGAAQKSVNPYIKSNTSTNANDGVSYYSSFGGGGGYGSGCVSNGGSTLARGGYYMFNKSRCYEYAPNSVANLPVLGDELLQTWYVNGIDNYTNGAGGGGGEGSPYTSGGNGGGGGYGVYLQAASLFAGNISVQGQPGFNGVYGLVGSGGGGGGGGGVILLAYGTKLVNGTYSVAGGAGGTGGLNSGFTGGTAANGLIGAYNYVSQPVTVCTGVCIGSNHYP